METPDKIYIGIIDNVVYTTVSEYFPGAIQYIRKDVLLKWIEEYQNTLSEFLKNKPSPVTAGKMYVLIKLLDKLNSM